MSQQIMTIVSLGVEVDDMPDRFWNFNGFLAIATDFQDIVNKTSTILTALSLEYSNIGNPKKSGDVQVPTGSTLYCLSGTFVAEGGVINTDGCDVELFYADDADGETNKVTLFTVNPIRGIDVSLPKPFEVPAGKFLNIKRTNVTGGNLNCSFSGQIFESST